MRTISSWTTRAAKAALRMAYMLAAPLSVSIYDNNIFADYYNMHMYTLITYHRCLPRRPGPGLSLPGLHRLLPRHVLHHCHAARCRHHHMRLAAGDGGGWAADSVHRGCLLGLHVLVSRSTYIGTRQVQFIISTCVCAGMHCCPVQTVTATPARTPRRATR